MPPPPVAEAKLAPPPYAQLGDMRHSVPTVGATGHWLKRLLSFVGPGYLVAVGYMDPGNWATDLAAGSGYGYALLSVILLSSLMAMFLQILAARLGIVSGLDLAQACRKHSSKPSGIAQWLLCEIAICACDLAEVIGTAIALKLLFGIPLTVGVVLTALDVFLILWLQQRGFRKLEAVIISLLALVFLCFAFNLLVADPKWGQVIAGFIPDQQTVLDPKMLFIAIGIIGATVMPHNLYLHSSIVQTRCIGETPTAKRNALKFVTIDIVTALTVAFFINAAILITAAAVFHDQGHTDVAEIEEAYRLLSPLTGSAIASIVFGIALLASGLSSSVTATLAGQIVMEGFVQLRMRPWLRRLLTRSIAIIPALVVTFLYGERGVATLLLVSQVVLSLQLPFAIVPLIRYTSSRKVMGEFANRFAIAAIAVVIVSVIISLNALLIYRTFS